MKKFIITVSIIICLILLADTCYYRLGIYMDFEPKKPVTTFITTRDDYIYMDSGDGYEKFEIKGVDIGSGIPGEWATNFGADKETYLRWFADIQELGANTIRIYTIHNDTFYEAFYEYNLNNPNPLWLIHGVWVNDYYHNSYRDAYHPDLYENFVSDCKTMIDIIHGNRKLSLGRRASAGHGSYMNDVSQWVIGYILGVEWEDLLVAYTNDKYKNDDEYNSYRGQYMFTSEEATPFEAMLARVGDKVLEYESERYKTQKLVAFSNWPITDPFTYPEYITDFFDKCASVDVENIKTTEKVLSGQFASYHAYPYYRDYLVYVKDWSELNFEVHPEDCYQDGTMNTYKLYLDALATHHKIPVVISEFGVPTGRGIAHKDVNTGRNQGHMNEQQQGQALVDCYEDIVSSGCAGCCVFSWQDEWFKRTWNTNHAVNFQRTPYWSDMQTNEQYFGLLAFDPGEKESICYVDGDVSEWTKEDIVAKDNGMTLSMKYDEASVYLMIHKPNLKFEEETFYVPIDTTQKSGSSFCENYNLLFDKAIDFLLLVNGSNNSSLLVQERYEVLRANYSREVYGFDTYVKNNIPDVDSPKFVDVNIILQMNQLIQGEKILQAEVFPTGKLRYGNANPESKNYDSLSDFYSKGDYIEIRLPWQLLNFSDPSKMEIHDDYYTGNYGIEPTGIDCMYLGCTDGATEGRIKLHQKELEPWGNDVTYHERLKLSYYMLQGIWKE